MPKVLCLDGLSEDGVTIMREAGLEVDVKPAQKPAELAAIIGEYDGLVVRSATKVTAEVFAAAKRLKVVGRAGVGTDNIDNPAATKRGVVVMNTPGGNTISTCEHTFALLLSLCRNVPAAHVSMAEGKWDRKKFSGTELCGKTLGIVGIGRIGSAVAKRAQAFEMKVIAFDPILTKIKAEALGIELVSIDELIERADFISIHAPKSEKTNNLIRAEHFKKMKPTCRIVNCARGGIVDEAALIEALNSGKVRSAAIDVWTSEPIAEGSVAATLAAMPNVVATPHLGASTHEAQNRVALSIARQIRDFLNSGARFGAVN